ncbi:MAG: UDP-galactopyranose mutase [Clostridiales bacterium 38-18]|nr:MAG: UDP-galactopyranose mutase [Clostridiales bacterium 38-18]
MKTYDYLIIGAGLYGSIFAHEATKKGKKCLVIEKRSHIAGNIYTREVEGINVHEYGAHIFHTSDEEVWTYINQFAKFNQYINSPIANYNGKLYNLPFNMNTFYQLWGEVKPERVRAIIDAQIEAEGIEVPQNLEEQALKLVGREIYETLVKGYTEKQWGKKATELPAFIIRRLPVRMTFDNNYFNDRFQGIPIGGYTPIVDKLLEGIEVRLNADFFADRNAYEALADQIVFTGMIDQFFDYQLGTLEYRSLRFETEVLEQSNYQGNAVVNYTDAKTPYTRIIEHKHFEYGSGDKTVITREYPQAWHPGDEPYYPVNDDKNNALYQAYKRLADTSENVIFGGRLAEYKYYDMHQIIRSVLDDLKNI